MQQKLRETEKMVSWAKLGVSDARLNRMALTIYNYYSSVVCSDDSIGDLQLISLFHESLLQNNHFTHLHADTRTEWQQLDLNELLLLCDL